MIVEVENQIKEYSKTEAALSDLRVRYENATFDVATIKGLTVARDARAEIRTWRTSLEKERVKIKEPALNYCRLIDAEAKRITVELLKLEEPIDIIIKGEEERKDKERLAKIEAENQRITVIQAKIDIFRNASLELQGKSSLLIATALEAVKATVIGEEYQEFAEVATGAKTNAIAAIGILYAEARANEAEYARITAEREELAKLREAQEARDKEDKKKRLEEEAKIKAEREAEDKKLREAKEAHEKKMKHDQEKAEKEKAEITRKQLELDKRKAEQEEAERLMAERMKKLNEARRDNHAVALMDIWKLAEDIKGNPNHQAVSAEICILAEANL